MARRSRSGIVPSFAYYRLFGQLTTEEIENQWEARRRTRRCRRGICKMGDLSGFGGSPEIRARPSLRAGRRQTVSSCHSNRGYPTMKAYLQSAYSRGQKESKHNRQGRIPIRRRFLPALESLEDRR